MGVGREHTDVWCHVPIVPYKMREVGEQLKPNVPTLVDESVALVSHSGDSGFKSRHSDWLS
jgi:hypothetical protein